MKIVWFICCLPIRNRLSIAQAPTPQSDQIIELSTINSRNLVEEGAADSASSAQVVLLPALGVLASIIMTMIIVSFICCLPIINRLSIAQAPTPQSDQIIELSPINSRNLVEEGATDRLSFIRTSGLASCPWSIGINYHDNDNGIVHLLSPHKKDTQ